MSSPSEPFLLATGVTVRIAPPGVPALHMSPPAGTTVTVLPVPGPPGVSGPAGERGPAGPPGSGGSSHEHVQSLAQSVWTVEHGLGRHPIAWSLFDASGRECDEYVVQHLDPDTVRVSMDTPTSGVIRLI